MKDFSLEINLLTQNKSICEAFNCSFFSKDGCQNYDSSRQATIENCILSAQNNVVLKRNDRLIYAMAFPNLEELNAYAISIETVRCEHAPIVKSGEAIPKLVNWANNRNQ
jgi:hypothetical protein